jgi:hypothetical protein
MAPMGRLPLLPGRSARCIGRRHLRGIALVPGRRPGGSSGRRAANPATDPQQSRFPRIRGPSAAALTCLGSSGQSIPERWLGRPLRPSASAKSVRPAVRPSPPRATRSARARARGAAPGSAVPAGTRAPTRRTWRRSAPVTPGRATVARPPAPSPRRWREPAERDRDQRGPAQRLEALPSVGPCRHRAEDEHAAAVHVRVPVAEQRMRDRERIPKRPPLGRERDDRHAQQCRAPRGAQRRVRGRVERARAPPQHEPQQRGAGQQAGQEPRWFQVGIARRPPGPQNASAPSGTGA